MKCLDLFCGGGGAARGLIAAGFEIVGVDIKDHRKSYPGHFVQGDALNPPFRLEDFDFVWASPPCQAFSAHTAGGRSSSPDLLPQTRSLLSGHPFTVIENVPGAPIRPDVVLTGPSVGLDRLWRRRHFEMSFLCLHPVPVRPTGSISDGTLVTANTKATPGSGSRARRRANGLPAYWTKGEMAEAMGLLDASMNRAEIGEAVPPAYAEFIGRAAIEAIKES